MISTRRMILMIAVFIMFLPVLSLAGTVNLPKTGQSTSYAAGDDGAIQAGIPWPSPRFKDNGNGTITDNLTGLSHTPGGYNVVIQPSIFRDLPKIIAPNRVTVPSIEFRPPKWKKSDIAVCDVRFPEKLYTDKVEGMSQFALLLNHAIQVNRFASGQKMTMSTFVAFYFSDIKLPQILSFRVLEVRNRVIGLGSLGNSEKGESTGIFDMVMDHGNVKMQWTEWLDLKNIFNSEGIEYFDLTAFDFPGTDIVADASPTFTLEKLNENLLKPFHRRGTGGGEIILDTNYWNLAPAIFRLKDLSVPLVEALIHEVGHFYGRGHDFILTNQIRNGLAVVTGEYGANVVDFMDLQINSSHFRPGGVGTLYPTLTLGATAEDAVAVSPLDMNLKAAQKAFVAAENPEGWVEAVYDPEAE